MKESNGSVWRWEIFQVRQGPKVGKLKILTPEFSLYESGKKLVSMESACIGCGAEEKHSRIDLRCLTHFPPLGLFYELLIGEIELETKYERSGP